MTASDRHPTDFYAVDELLTEERQRIRGVVREFCDRQVPPVTNDH